MKAVLYARVSSEEQIDNWSISAQKHEFSDLCQQKGWQSTGIYCEEGVSAHTDSIEKRPQFKRLLEDCRNRNFDVVVVHSLDRWSRNLGVTLESFKRLAESGIAFVSITENIDYSTPEGKLFIAMIGAFAQYFSDSLSKHTSKGMKERALNGLPNGAIPFGYRREDLDKAVGGRRHIFIVPEEAEAVKQIFQMYASGGHSLSSLASWLNEKKFRTRNIRGIKDGSGNTITGPRPFTSFSVRWILHNPFFTGKVNYRGQLHPGIHEAIIDEALFNKVQAGLKRAKGQSRSISSNFRIYLLKGLIRCIYCGNPIWSETNSHGYSLYREKRGTRSTNDCPVGEKSIRCDQIDEQVNEILSSVALDPSWKERIIARISTRSEHDQILRERKSINDRLRRLSKTYVDGLIEDGEYELQRKLLQDRLSTLVIPEMEAAMDAGAFLENLGIIWTKATMEEKHKLLVIMLDAVYVDLLTSRKVVGILPKPAFYHLFESLKRQKDSKVIVFKPDDYPEDNDQTDCHNTMVGLVETGEG